MYYIIQENLFKEFHFNTLIEYLKRYGLEYEVVKYIPFAEDIQFTTDRKDVWCFGSVSMAKSAHKYGWNPGCMYNENHDMEIQYKYYGDELLNGDGFVMKATDPIPEEVPYAFFARPTKDTKSFSGQCFTKDSWREYIDMLIASGVAHSLKAETKVLIAPLKNTQQEIRCWIVDGKPVTISQYKIGARVNYLNMDNNEEAIIYATKMAKIYSPARAFVMDICLYEDEYRIVEINCINCSGFYDGNMSKLIQALEASFSNEPILHHSV